MIYYEITQERMVGRRYALPRDFCVEDRHTQTQTLRGALRVARKWAREYGARVRVDFVGYDPAQSCKYINLCHVSMDALDRVWVDVSPEAARAGLL